MKLGEAKLCLDCEEVFKEGKACPACGSRAWFFIKKWLDREIRSEDWLKQHVCLREGIKPSPTGGFWESAGGLKPAPTGDLREGIKPSPTGDFTS